MELVEVFQILGIEPTKEEKALKDAYRARLAVTNPEDDPEGFKRLRTAYEEACRYARTVENADAEVSGLQDGEEDTPAGQWVRGAQEIYGNLADRCNLQKWRELFEQETFLSLEEEENCTIRLLRFLMEHFKLPTEVWKLLDEKLHIVQNAGKFRERFPAQFVAYMVHKCQNGEEIDFSRFTGAADADYDQFLQYYDRAVRVLQEDDTEEAQRMIDCGDTLGITHPRMEVCRAVLREKKGQNKEALELLEKLSAQYPEDDLIRYSLADCLWENGSREEAARLCEKLCEKSPKHHGANKILASWYYEQKRYKEARQCAEKVLSAGEDDECRDLLCKINPGLEADMTEEYARTQDADIGLELGWCYLQDGKFDRGIRLAQELEEKISPDKRAEYLGLLTRLYVEAAEYEKAIAVAADWEESLDEKDTKGIRQSHLIRMQCYGAMGYGRPEQLPEAIREAEKAQTGTMEDIRLLLDKAQLYIKMEEYEKSTEITEKLTEDYQIYAAYANELEAAKRQWNAGGVIEYGRICLEYFPTYVRAYELMAKVYADLKKTEELKGLLKQEADNKVKSVILDAYEWQLSHEKFPDETLNERIQKFRTDYLQKVEDGKLTFYEEGLPVITEYLYSNPCEYLLVERAIFHKAAGHLEEAKADYEKALAEEPANPYAWNGLASIHQYLGEYEEAMVCLRKAMLYIPTDEDGNIPPGMLAEQAEAYMRLGNYPEAEKMYEKFLMATGRDGERNTRRMRDYAKCLYYNGKKGKAMHLLDRAFANVLDATSEKADLCMNNGEDKFSRELLEAWPEQMKLTNQNTQSAQEEYQYSMAWYELLYGSAEKSIECFEKSVLHRVDEIGTRGMLGDLVFACILGNNEYKGKLYADHLKYWLDRDKKYGTDCYKDMPKLGRVYRYLAAYYTPPSEPPKKEEKKSFFDRFLKRREKGKKI